MFYEESLRCFVSKVRGKGRTVAVHILSSCDWRRQNFGNVRRGKKFVGNELWLTSMSEPAVVPPSSSKTSGTTTNKASTPAPNSARGGIYAALRYTGIPESWIRRPRLPSRNWLIFLGVTSSIAGAYVYDRRKCREIREGYVRRVEHLAQVPMRSSELPRKVTVFAAKWPGDDDYSRGVRYFRKYVKVRNPLYHNLIC